MDKLEIAKSVINHLGLTPNDLPSYLFHDDRRKYELEDLDDRLLAHYNEDTLSSLKTVRFIKDFTRFGSGIHKETTNDSFKRTAVLFRQLGIKNYYFHLQLNNPLLINVNPWDPNLPDEFKFMVMQEASENIWYVIRELIKIDGVRFIGNRAVLSFIWCCLNHINTLILLPRQSGKESWNSSLVKTPGGWSKIGDIKLGDKVVAPDGTITNVIGVYPQGFKPAYSVGFKDGRKTVVGPEHLWEVFDNDNRIARVITTLECLDIYNEYKEIGKELLVRPIVPEDGESTDFILSPYMLGEKLTKEVIKPDNLLRPSRQDRYLKQYQLLNRKEEHYFIPIEYKHSKASKQRLELLNGIMDGLGRVKDKIYATVHSERLGRDIQYLARSLGYLCYLEEKDGFFKVIFEGKDLYKLFTKEKLISKAKVLEKNSEEFIGIPFDSFMLLPERKDCTCIEVDHEDHLFITDDFIVTHNTVGMQVLIFILQYIVGRGYKSGLITLASNNRQQFVNAIKKIRSGLPEYMVRMSYKDKDSGNILTYEGHGEEFKNVFEIRVPSGGKDGAENVSRGSTFGTLLYDEPAWTKFIENIMTGSGPATLTEQRNMLRKGYPWFTAKATTPNSVTKEEGKYMYNEFLSSTVWREAYFDSFSESHLFEWLIKLSPKKTTYPKVVLQYNHLQLGFGEDWIVKTMDKLNLTWAKAKIDLLMMWTEEGKNKIFDDKTREILQESKQEHVRFEEVNKTKLFLDWFYKQDELQLLIDDPTEFLLIGCDTSDAIGGDNDACTVTLTRIKTGEVVGTGRYSLAFLGDVRDVLVYLLINIPNSLLIIERNRAQQIIDEIILILSSKGIDPFTRIYNEIYEDPIKHANDYKDVTQTKPQSRSREFYLRFKSKFGFQTNSRSREMLYGLVFEAVQNTGTSARYGQLIDELIGLQTGSNGRIDHEVKGHDDIVISWLLNYWFLRSGHNKSFYGIPTGHILTNIRTLSENKSKNKYTQKQIESFALIRDKITKLTDQLLNCNSDLIAPRIESEIKKLADLLPNELKRMITIDEVIEETKKERQKRIIEKRKLRSF